MTMAIRFRPSPTLICVTLLALLSPLPVVAGSAGAVDVTPVAAADNLTIAQETCLFDALKAALQAGTQGTTVGDLRRLCDRQIAATNGSPTIGAESTAAMPPPEEGASFREQITAEQQSLDRSYSLTPHWPNYLLAYSHNRYPNSEGLDTPNGEDADEQESALQVSVKFPVWREIFGSNNDLLFGYTSKSWFQAYNNDLSKPFRETNYEPEVFWRHHGGPRVLGMEIASWDLGYLHQSNGRSEPLSRSWDRLNARLAVILHPNVSLLLRAWYRLPEEEDDDDNPDIHQYLGYGDVRAIWAPNRNTFTTLYRPGTRKDAVELTWSYPINDHFRIYAQYFRGYGESLIDYDHKVERFGIGFSINDYLQAR